MAYDATRQRFIRWLIEYPTRSARASAKAQGEDVALSVKEWAESNNVDRVTCQRWKKDSHESGELAEGYRNKFLGPGDVAEILDAMVCKAKDGSVQAASLVMKMAGMLGAGAQENPTHQTNNVLTVEALKALTPKQLAAIAGGTGDTLPAELDPDPDDALWR